MGNQTRWMVAAVAGALWMAPAIAQTSSGASGDDARATATGTSSDPNQRGDTGAAQKASPDRAMQNSEVSQPPGTKSGTGSGTMSNEPSASSTKTSASPHGSAATATENTTLLQKLHAGNQAEIEAGKWMQQHAQNDKVKDFAKKMVKDHTDMDKDVLKYAEKQGISLTGGASSDPAAAKDQQHMHMMQGMPAQQADRHYMTMMVEDHQRDVSEVRSAEQQAKSSDDKDLQKLLSSTAKKMEDHLKDAQKIQRDLGSRQARTPSSR